MSHYLQRDAEEIRRHLAPGVSAPSDEPDLFLIYAVLLRTKGEGTTLEDVHDAWAAWMTMRGEDHQSLVPFAELSPDVQSEDAPFVAAIHRAVRAR